ncbi:MAG: hypothetical protein ACR2PT_10690 [Endozoicomonas sp.]
MPFQKKLPMLRQEKNRSLCCLLLAWVGFCVPLGHAEYRIEGLDDKIIDIQVPDGIYSGNGVFYGEQDYYVIAFDDATNERQPYRVTPISQRGDFRLRNDGSAQPPRWHLPFTFKWQGGTRVDGGPGAYEELRNGGTSSAYLGGLSRSDTHYSRAKIRVEVRENDLAESWRAGVYQSTITLSDASTGSISGTFTVRVRISPATLVSGLRDLDLGTWSGAGSPQAEESFCVFARSLFSPSLYNIEARGSGAGGAYVLVEPSGKAIPYQLELSVNPAGFQSATPGQIINSGAGSEEFDCRSADASKARLRIIVKESDLASARAGAYTGTLHLTVSIP